MSALNMTICPNGDQYVRKRLVLNRKRIQQFEVLLDNATEILGAKNSVRLLCTPNNGTRVKDLDSIVEGGIYVAITRPSDKLIKLQYDGSRAKQPKHREPKHREKPLNPNIYFRRKMLSQVQARAFNEGIAEATRHRHIYVHCNGDSRGMKLHLDKRILISLDKVLQFISDKIKLRTGAVRSLHTLDGREIRRLSTIENNGTYVAVGFGQRFQRARYTQQQFQVFKSPRRAATNNVNISLDPSTTTTTTTSTTTTKVAPTYAKIYGKNSKKKNENTEKQQSPTSKGNVKKLPWFVELQENLVDEIDSVNGGLANEIESDFSIDGKSKYNNITTNDKSISDILKDKLQVRDDDNKDGEVDDDDRRKITEKKNSFSYKRQRTFEKSNNDDDDDIVSPVDSLNERLDENNNNDFSGDELVSKVKSVDDIADDEKRNDKFTSNWAGVNSAYDETYDVANKSSHDFATKTSVVDSEQKPAVERHQQNNVDNNKQKTKKSSTVNTRKKAKPKKKKSHNKLENVEDELRPSNGVNNIGHMINDDNENISGVIQQKSQQLSVKNSGHDDGDNIDKKSGVIQQKSQLLSVKNSGHDDGNNIDNKSASSIIFKASGDQSEIAQQVTDNQETQIEKTIDMTPAQEVEEDEQLKQDKDDDWTR